MVGFRQSLWCRSIFGCVECGGCERQTTNRFLSLFSKRPGHFAVEDNSRSKVVHLGNCLGIISYAILIFMQK